MRATASRRNRAFHTAHVMDAAERMNAGGYPRRIWACFTASYRTTERPNDAFDTAGAFR
jgi:hypothetical protein